MLEADDRIRGGQATQVVPESIGRQPRQALDIRRPETVEADPFHVGREYSLIGMVSESEDTVEVIST
jgi:hypothetical protein